MPNNLEYYYKTQQQLCQWLPQERITRIRNMALLILGLHLSGTVHMALIVRSLNEEYAGSGGGLYLANGSALLENNAIYDNVALQAGTATPNVGPGGALLIMKTHH